MIEISRECIEKTGLGDYFICDNCTERATIGEHIVLFNEDEEEFDYYICADCLESFREEMLQEKLFGGDKDEQELSTLVRKMDLISWNEVDVGLFDLEDFLMSLISDPDMTELSLTMAAAMCSTAEAFKEIEKYIAGNTNLTKEQYQKFQFAYIYYNQMKSEAQEEAEDSDNAQ